MEDDNLVEVYSIDGSSAQEVAEQQEEEDRGMIRKLCVISTHYPSKDDPIYAFVGTLISAVADQGVECHVISPVSNVEKQHRAVSRTEITPKGAEIHVYCPPFQVFPSRKILGFETYRLTVASKQRTIRKTFKKYIGSCDAVYAHFIDSGVQAALLSEKEKIPAFVAIGESKLTNKQLSYSLYMKELRRHINGVVSVSSELKKDAEELGLFSANTPIEVFPNGIDTGLFKPMDKTEQRKKLGLSENDFVVSFVGAFSERKGFDKVQQVISRHPDWKCILIGNGSIPVTVPQTQIVFTGRISHDQIPAYLCASDAFVLPTKAEGCCNAIIEAMGCGLPVVSSDRGFNDDILKKDYSILIDPEDTDAIERALMTYASDPQLRQEHASKCLQAGRALSIERRAANIIRFMERNL